MPDPLRGQATRRLPGCARIGPLPIGAILPPTRLRAGRLPRSDPDPEGFFLRHVVMRSHVDVLLRDLFAATSGRGANTPLPYSVEA